MENDTSVSQGVRLRVESSSDELEGGEALEERSNGVARLDARSESNGSILIEGSPPPDVMQLSLQQTNEQLNNVFKIKEEDQAEAVQISLDLMREGVKAVDENGRPNHAIRLAYFREMSSMFGLAMADRLKLMEGFERMVARTMTHSERTKKIEMSSIRAAISPHAAKEMGL